MADSTPTTALLRSSTLISQGAEAASSVYFLRTRIANLHPQKVYRTSLHPGGAPLLLKHRFSKRYRHSTLDASLTRARITGEARALLRCLRCYDFISDFIWLRTEVACSCGVSVPGLRFVDAANGVLGIQWVNGRSVRYLLGSGDEGEEADSNEDGIVADQDPLVEYGVPKGMTSHILHFKDTNFSHGAGAEALMTMVGTEIAKMHLADIIHGDLTTSNMMLRHPSSIRDSPDGTQQLVRRHTSMR